MLMETGIDEHLSAARLKAIQPLAKHIGGNLLCSCQRGGLSFHEERTQ